MVEADAPQSTSIEIAERELHRSSPCGAISTDQRRAAQAAGMLGALAVASFAALALLPGQRLDPLEMLQAMVAAQVVGAGLVTSWLVWRRPSTGA